MTIVIIWFVLGLAILVAGAELLVRGASQLASSFGISKLIIGLSIVAFGTSAPELAVCIQAGLAGETDILLGNVIGSNISNILLVLGISAIILPLYVNPRLIRLDVPVMIAVTLLLLIFALNGSLAFWNSLVFVILLIVYLIYLARSSREKSSLTSDIPLADENSKGLGSRLLQLFFVVTGLVLLITGAHWLVDSATRIAEAIGISELIIGLTVVAVGTSLPEITTAVVAAVRRERELVISSIIGSNILNILAVLGISGLIIPESIPVQNALLRFDLLILLAASFACIPILFTGHLISRWEGGLFFGYYIAYIAYLWLTSADHQALPIYSTAMILFVLPLTVITILVIATREWKKRRRVWKHIHKG